jgi:hypothetical protein
MACHGSDDCAPAVVTDPAVAFGRYCFPFSSFPVFGVPFILTITFLVFMVSLFRDSGISGL